MIIALQMNMLNELLGSFIKHIPNLLGALFILIVGWMLAKLISKTAKKIFRAINVDRLAEKLNDIDLVSNLNMDIKLSNVLGDILYYVIMLLLAAVATDILNIPTISNLVNDTIKYVPNLLTAMLVFAVGIILSDYIRKIIDTTCASIGIPSGKVISSILFYFLLIMTTISALEQARISTDFIKSNLLLIIGGTVLAFGVGYGFASRETFANMLATFYTKGKFDVGDHIRIGNVKGKIVAIDSNSITIETSESKCIIPMSRFAKEDIEIFNQP